MLDKKMNQSEYSCCDVPASGEISICKECGNKGKSVKEITLRSLVKESKLKIIKNFEGFYFCETPTCQVVYFSNSQQVYLYKVDIKVRVGIKETEDPIPVCYCFGWTRDRIFDQIKQLGYSNAVQEISAKVKSGECACEIKNPSGRCCLGGINKMVKRDMKLYDKNPKQELKARDNKLTKVSTFGSIVSAIVASICCIGPVVLAVLGVGGAGLFSKFESLRPFFIGITVVLLGSAFYLTYKKRNIKCRDGTYKVKSAGKWNKIALWGATILAVFFVAFPYLHLSNQSPASGQGTEVIIPVKGMTCSGCEFDVENAVRKLGDGIIQVKADYQKGEVYAKFAEEKVTIVEIVEAINKAGYKATKP